MVPEAAALSGGAEAFQDFSFQLALRGDALGGYMLRYLCFDRNVVYFLVHEGKPVIVGCFVRSARGNHHEDGSSDRRAAKPQCYLHCCCLPTPGTGLAPRFIARCGTT